MSLELMGHGPGTAQAYEVFRSAARKYPGTTRLKIDYRGTHPRVTPDYTPRASGSVRFQQETLGRRLVEIRRLQLEALDRRLEEIRRSFE